MDRPSLEQDDIKAQFNSILSPYGILFPEHDILDSNIKESSPFALTFTIASNNEIQRQVSATSQPSVANTKNPDNSKGKDRPDARVPWKMVGMSGEPGLNGATSDPSLPDDKFDEHEKNPVGVYSVGETEFTEKSIKSIEKSEWDSSSRNPKDKKGFKSGFKLSQGWKKFRRSLRQTHSTGQEDKHNNGLITEGRKNNSLSTVDIQGHKALSEVDSPPEHDIEEAVGSKSIKSRFRSGSLREFLHKGSSSSSLIESENRDSKSIKGGAVVVSAESIMGQGKMHQYSKDNLIKQQKQSRQSSGKSPLSEPGNLESGYALPPDNSSSRTDNDSQPSVSAHEPAGFYNLPVEENPQDQQNNVVDDKEASNSSNIQSLAISDVDESKKSTEQEFYPPAQGMLQSPLSSRRWRLSMHRMSLVYGTICESKQEDNEHYLRQLMRNSTPDQDASQDAGTSEKPDHQDKAFKVPLSQSLQLASATFENGLRVPLSIYYVTEELRIREHNTQIEELFPEECDTKDVAFEELVEIFDKRPFGQDADLSIKTSVTSSNVEPENLVESAEGEHTTDDATTTECIQQTKPRSVTSRDLTRIVLRFLTDLPEPLITPDVFTTFSSMIQLQTIDSIKVQASSLLVQMLPMEQRQLLRFLLEFLDEVIFKPFKDDIQRLELNTPGDLADESIGYKHQQDLDLRNKEYKEQMLRISKAFGVACSQVGTSHGTANLSLARNKSQNSLYRHYKKEFELKAQQEKIAIAVRNSQEVFQFLMNYRVNIFGPSFISLFPSVSKERVEILSRFRNSVQRSDNDDQVEYNRDNIEKPILEQDRTNHKSLQFNRRLRNHLGPRRLAKLRFQDKMRLGAKGSRTLPVFKNRQSGTDLHNIHKMPSSSSFCDSGVEFSSVDLVALAAMKEHKARSMRIMKHIPCPSVATLHSIQVEMGSIIGVKEVDSNITPTSKSSGSRIMDTHDDVSSVMTGTSQRDIEELEYEKMQDISEDRRQDSKMCFKDFLEEPLDRKQQEREIRMVEKDILKSEVTTKFLTSSLVGLYPSSSTAPIPVVILPSARAMIAQTIKIPGLRGSTILTQEKSTTRSRELTLTPQEEIKLPSDHTSADDCLCTYCSTQVKPSKIPVLSKTEYELAELQSQCDSKDQHIAELLKAVQSLQGQVNVLNAKLLFLHDHHTTRPMRRRTLACNSYPLIPVTNNSGQDNAYQEQRQSTQQQKSGPGVLKSHSLTASANANSPNTLELIEFFPEVQTNNHAAKQRSTDLGPSLGLESLGEEDEMVSFLDLDSHPSPSLFPAHATYQSEFSRVPLLQSTAALNVDHAFNFDRSMMNVRCETGLERALRDIDEFEKEPERGGEDQFDEHYYLDAYKTMDQQLYRRPNLPVSPSPQPMSSGIHKKHHRISLPIQSLMSKRISLGNSFRWKGRTAAA